MLCDPFLRDPSTDVNLIIRIRPRLSSDSVLSQSEINGERMTFLSPGAPTNDSGGKRPASAFEKETRVRSGLIFDGTFLLIAIGIGDGGSGSRRRGGS